MKRWLGLIVGATTAMVVLAFVVPLSLAIRGIERQAEIDGVERSAVALAAFVDDQATPESIEDALVRFDEDQPGIDVTVYARDGAVFGAGAPADEHVDAAFTGRASTTLVGGGVQSYVPNNGPFAVDAASTYVIRLDAPDDVVDLGVRRLVAVLLGSTLVAAVIGGGAGAAAGRWIVRPTKRLTETARRLQAGDLDARATPDGPEELCELAAALNHLATRIDELMGETRENVADIAHRMRTPLTALYLEIEALPESEDRRSLYQRVEQLNATLSEIIAAMRTRQNTAIDSATDSADICAVTRERLADWADVAGESGRSLTLASAPDGQRRVNSSAADLEAAIDAVVGNALTHTPPGTAVEVSILDDEATVRLAIDDTGPGFPDTTIVERGVTGTRSTGLGLDIARRVAVDAGGSFEIGVSPSGGARAVLTFPLLASPRPEGNARWKRHAHRRSGDR